MNPVVLFPARTADPSRFAPKEDGESFLGVLAALRMVTPAPGDLAEGGLSALLASTSPPADSEENRDAGALRLELPHPELGIVEARLVAVPGGWSALLLVPHDAQGVVERQLEQARQRLATAGLREIRIMPRARKAYRRQERSASRLDVVA